MTLDELVKQVPAEVATRVDKTRQRFNGVIRNILREEMALRLNFSSGSDTSDGSSRESVSVPVSVCAGVPRDAAKTVKLEEEDALVILIGRYRSTLEALAQSTNAAMALANGLQTRNMPTPEPMPDGALLGCQTWAKELLAHLKNADPLTKILNFNEDILGRYICRLPFRDQHGNFIGSDPFKGEIELYWAVIGLVAELLNCTPEDLTVVVLAHELAHAYTHIGADIDGARWATTAFSQSELPLKEGLAQYYTWRVCNRLADRASGCLSTFESLLACQPQPYRAHSQWIKDESSSEHVRLAMLETRRTGSGTVAAFEALLDQARQRLTRKVDSEKLFDSM